MKVFDSIKRKAVLSLTLTFGLLFAAATALIYYLEMPLAYGFYISLTIAGLQYLLGPFIFNRFNGLWGLYNKPVCSALFLKGKGIL